MWRKGIVVVVYLLLAIFAIAWGYAVFLLYAPIFLTNVSHSQQEHAKVSKKERMDLTPSTHAVQTPTTSFPWGIALDTLQHIVWIAEPGCEPTPTCPTSASGVLGEYDLLDGSWIQDFPEPPGYSKPTFVAIDTSGTVWFTEPGSDAIGDLNPQNMTWNQWKVPGGSTPFDLTFDTQGNLWFTDFDANAIGFFNPHTHKLVENPIPTPNSNPYGITRDPRGTIWFAENRLGVGRIASFTPTASGRVAIVEHQVTTTQPHLITTDRHGNIWYSEGFAGSLGEYTPVSGKSVDYPVSVGRCTHEVLCKTHISGISVDSEGDIWYSDSELALVGYLIPSNGHLVTKTVNSQHSSGSNRQDGAYDGLAVDGYNDVWYTLTYRAQIVLWPKKTVK